MADRDRYDWERGRDFGDRNRDRDAQDRGMVSRGADEVRSWFGDDEARRRREMDEQREGQWSGQSERNYGANSDRARSEHGWMRDDPRPGRWESGQSPQQGGYAEQQRQYSPRGRDWPDPGYEQGGSRWSGGSRDYGDETRRAGNWTSGPSGNYTPGQTNPSFSGGYGAGNYESESYRSGSFGSGSGSGPLNYGRDFGTPGEGRWGQQQYGGSAFGGGTFAGRGPRNYQRSDERVREDINERLTADPRVDASDIDVRVQNGEVTLTGMVDDRRTRRLAEEVIEDLPGVRDVRNELRVNRGSDWGDDSHRYVGEQSRGHEDGALGHTGDPQKRDDVTTLNAKDTSKK